MIFEIIICIIILSVQHPRLSNLWDNKQIIFFNYWGLERYFYSVLTLTISAEDNKPRLT